MLREIRAGPGAARIRCGGCCKATSARGKTVVAACSALMALESGFNVALMAPTEILAEQHFTNFTPLV